MIWGLFKFSFDTSINIGQGIWDFIKTIPDLIWGLFEFSLQTSISVGQVIWDFLKTLPALVWDVFQFSIDTMIATVQGFWDFVITLPTLIINGIKSVFIPDPDNINASIETLKKSFLDTFGIGDFDLSGVMGVSSEVSNKSGTVSILGFEFEGTFLDVTYIKRAVEDFRPYIRGFILLLLGLYNINQVANFLGVGELSLGNYINIKELSIIK